MIKRKQDAFKEIKVQRDRDNKELKTKYKDAKKEVKREVAKAIALYCLCKKGMVCQHGVKGRRKVHLTSSMVKSLNKTRRGRSKICHRPTR